MKISCEIIKDLLPLYHDGVCSEESKVIVEEHLKECAECSKELELISGTFTVTGREENLESAKAVKNLSKKWRRGMLKSVIKGIIIAVVTIAVLVLALSIFIDFRIV